MAATRSNAYMLSSATLMIAPAFTTNVYDLTPEEHSVGIIKEASVTLDSSSIELTNGVAQAVVDSKKTGVKPSITGTAYEFTARNIAYSLSMSEGAGVVRRGVLKAAVAGGATTLTIDSDPIPGDAATAITTLADIPVGSTILIQDIDGRYDRIFPTKTSAEATGDTATGFSLTLGADYALPADMGFLAGAKVYIVPSIKVGDLYADDLFCVKLVGTLSNYERPVVFVFPKVKMAKGFQISFTETDYGGMPWELTPLLMNMTEATGRLADIGTTACGDVYVAA